mmetsp:Transcript_10457/g.14407  ORF Transcript_10457/g.14407 Transcript_10457/m.14407 type:complete len:188 (-) Transcript_10457:112-675(-)
MSVPFPPLPDFVDPVLQAERPTIIAENNLIVAQDIVNARNFELVVIAAASHAEIQNWKRYIVDLEYKRFADLIAPAVAAAVGPAVTAAVGPAVNAAFQPFMRNLALTSNRLAFLQTTNGPLLPVSNEQGITPGGDLFPATIKVFEDMTIPQLDALIAFYGVPLQEGDVKLEKQRVLRPLIGDYRPYI